MFEKAGYKMLVDPCENKGTAFSEAERERYGLTGLIPETVESIATQRQRCMAQFDANKSALEKYVYLAGLLNYNEKLFYNLAMSDPAKFLPILYTPTVGEACQQFSTIFRQSRGMYLSLKRKGHVKEILKNWPEQDVRIICVTDGSRILGLGDLGANGMGIPLGKLQNYTICAGIPPESLLPVMLDVGTNNEKLLSDPLYTGLRQKRCTTEELYSLADEFVEAVQEVFPDCCIQFEDWSGPDAVALLARYRDKISMFNDDIQGTAAVNLSAMSGACRIKKTKITEESFLFLGAGSAATGLSDLLCKAMTAEGMTIDEARKRIRLFDVNGLVEKSRTDLFEFQKPYAHDDQPLSRDRFLEAVIKFRPTTLIGVSTAGGAFTPDIIRAMAEINDRPVIFPMSNPISHAECTAEDAYRYTDGRVIFASGSRFDALQYNGKEYIPGQINNFYIFPAVGLAVYATKCMRVTDEMFIECARAVAAQVPSGYLLQGRLFPDQSNMLETEIKAACKVAEMIFARGLAKVSKPADVETWIRSMIYVPEY